METNKENRKEGMRLKATSKIPLPIDPLPSLPRQLIEGKSNKEDRNARKPLKTINSQAGTSYPYAKPQKQNTPLNLDTKFVTHRKRLDELDWEFKVFKDGKPNKSNGVICISDDDEEEPSVKDKRFFDEVSKNDCRGGKDVVTPGKSRLEPLRVRNIKRSFKRPHSRELQGLSPGIAKQNKGDERVKRRLFIDRFTERLQPPDFVSQLYMACLARHYTTDIFEYLIKTEQKPVAVPKINNNTRACIINWLIKVNGCDGNPATVQTACWYFDSVLAIGNVELENMQLLAAACFWIAQKLQGPAVSAMRLVRCANHAFSPAQLFVAEKAIIWKLKFPKHPVVAHNYVSYLSWWCNNQNPGEIEVAATFISLSGLMVDRVLCDQYPCVVAAAAVTNALALLNKKSLISRLQMSPVYKLAEKKSAGTIKNTCSVLHKSVRSIASPLYEYKAPLELYGIPPHYIAHRVMHGACGKVIPEARMNAG